MTFPESSPLLNIGGKSTHRDYTTRGGKWSCGKLTKMLLPAFVLIVSICVLYSFYSVTTFGHWTKITHPLITTAVHKLTQNSENSEKVDSIQSVKKPVQEEIETSESPPHHNPVKCNYPKLDPFDPIMLKYMDKIDPVDCAKNHSPLFRIELDKASGGYYDLVQVEDVREYNYSSCCFRSCWLLEPDGESPIAHQPTCLHCIKIRKERTRLNAEVDNIRVECTPLDTLENKTLILVDSFSLIPIKSIVQDKVERMTATLSKEELESRVNVVIFGMDSVSHMNFIRSMPKSHAFLKDKLGALHMDGYNKVAENTAPNLMAALTGYLEPELGADGCYDLTLEEDGLTVIDECPLVWKVFEKENYVTAWGDDSTYGGVYDFFTVPTDYYLNPVTYKLEDDLGHTDPEGESICYGNRMGYEEVLNFLKQMALSMKTQFGNSARYFQFGWSISLTHADLITAPLGDDSLLEMLSWFHNEGYLQDHTVLIIMSDHGMWHGGHLDTLPGRLERVLPFIYFLFPDWFKRKYPVAIQNFENNVDKLTSHFDLHETLLDLANLSNIEDSRVVQRGKELDNWKENIDREMEKDESGNSNSYEHRRKGATWPRGISLFLPIPSGRLCVDAGIDAAYCACGDRKLVSPQDHPNLTEEAGEAIIQKMNEMFVNHPICCNLTLGEVVSLQLVDMGKVGQDPLSEEDTTEGTSTLSWLEESGDGEGKVFYMTLKALPSGGVFDANLKRGNDGGWIVSDRISRSNVYGNQSSCVKEHWLKPFCFCRDE